MIVQAPPGRARGAIPLVRRFQLSDYVYLHDAVAMVAGKPLVGDPEAAGEAYAAGGPAFTAEVPRGTPVGAAGLFFHWPGRATGWAILAPSLIRDRRLIVWFTREVAERLPALMVRHGIRRLEADVLPAGIAWVRRLGFELEVDMPLYGPGGETFYRFVRLTRG
jgi:hypothetical protein